MFLKVCGTGRGLAALGVVSGQEVFRLFVVGQRLRDFVLSVVRSTPIVISKRIIRFKLDGLVEISDGAIVVAFVLVSRAPVVVGVG